MSRTIATVMLVGIALTAGGAVGGWVLGLWGRGAEAELLKIFPDAELLVDERGARLFLTVKNEGSKDAIIMKIIVERVGEAKLDGVAYIPAGRLWKSPPGGLQIVINNANQIVVGEPYMVKAITESGNSYHVIVRARSP